MVADSSLIFYFWALAKNPQQPLELKRAWPAPKPNQFWILNDLEEWTHVNPINTLIFFLKGNFQGPQIWRDLQSTRRNETRSWCPSFVPSAPLGVSISWSPFLSAEERKLVRGPDDEPGTTLPRAWTPRRKAAPDRSQWGNRQSRLKKWEVLDSTWSLAKSTGKPHFVGTKLPLAYPCNKCWIQNLSAKLLLNAFYIIKQ